MIKVAALLFTILIMLSCTVSRQQTGQYNQIDAKPVMLSKSKNVYLLWDAIPVRQAEKYVTVPDYEIIKRRNAFDAVITYGTLGLVSFYTVKIMIKTPPQTK